MSERFRIFVPESEADKLPAEVEVVAQYPAFAIVSASEDVIKELQKRYVVEPLKSLEPRTLVPEAAPMAAAMGEKRKRGPYRLKLQSSIPVEQSWLQQLDEAGYEVQDTIGNRTVVLIARNKKSVAKLRDFPNVEHVEDHVPEVMLSPGFLDNLGVQADEEAVAQAAARVARGEVEPSSRAGLSLPNLIATFLTEEDAQRAQRSLRRQGIRNITPAGKARIVINLAGDKDPLQSIQKIMERPGLSRLAEQRLKRTRNNLARHIIGSQVVAQDSGGLELTGKGEIVAVADTGLDTGNATTIHADFQRRVRDIQDFPIAASLSAFVHNPSGSDGPADIYSGHGTHVCGSVLGNGARSITLGLDPIQGMAVEAELVFQAIEQTPTWNMQGILHFLTTFGQSPPHHGLFGIPDDLSELFQAAYDQGARIHSDSWGGGYFGEYDEQCEDLDQFVWDHKDFLVVVAAGNDGEDTNPPGSGIDPMSVTSPGTAKNCLTVGASENHRPGFTDTYGEWWPNDYPRRPFKTDRMADSTDDIVAFSSRGPCKTGRLKPDVVTPGTYILSTRSSQMPFNNFAWSAFPPAKNDYMHMGGTSMATPLVAGGAALVRQYLRETVGVANPSAALLKAAIIHSAQYHQYRYAHPSSSVWADNEQGWGRVDLKQVLNPVPPKRVLFIDESAGLQTGEMSQFDVDVTGASVPLRITMVYSDYPGENLVNNLNLLALAPNGQFFVGNDFEGSGVPDSPNNVEGIVVENPEPGTWTIRVIASEVLMGPQDFALVLSGAGVRLV